MKDLRSYLDKKKNNEKSAQKKRRSLHVDDQTIAHLFSRMIREEFGRQGEKYIVPTYYKNGVIFVKISNPMWAQELWMQRDRFVHLLNEKVGNHVVTHIKIAT